MHIILNRTHRKSNIDLLKARDYYFEKARKANNIFRRICLLSPIVISVVFMIFGSVINISDTDTWLDIIVGVVAVIAFVIDLFIQNYIDTDLEKSNILREEYDCIVFGIPHNPFLGDSSEERIAELKKVADKTPDKGKYEVWYREAFSDNNVANAICGYMDNTIYKYYIYSDYKNILFWEMATIALFFVIYTIWYLATPDDYFVAMVNPFILFIALFDWIKDIVGSFFVSREQILSSKKVISFVENHKDEIMADSANKDLFLRSIQDAIFNSREKSLFVPKSIRDKHLDNKSEYYKWLDRIKSLYWGKDITKPMKPEDYEIPAVVTYKPLPADIKENSVTNLKQIHDVLLEMLEDVKRVLDKNGIRFMLDGGTLIGAVRKSNSHSFLPWDDDVDISIHSEDADSAIRAIREELSEKYVVQDYYSEDYYSPRLSRFRVRTKNSTSIIDEKDSELFEKYADRGLFLDVYAFSPIICCIGIDSLVRRVVFQRLHKNIRKTEQLWKTKDKKDKYLARFRKQKRKYMRWAQWYKKYAKCMDYYTYEPHYLEDINMPGPYIKREDIYGDIETGIRTVLFENSEFEVPINYEAVLSAFYGYNWEKSPYMSIEQLKGNGSKSSIMSTIKE